MKKCGRRTNRVVMMDGNMVAMCAEHEKLFVHYMARIGITGLKIGQLRSEALCEEPGLGSGKIATAEAPMVRKP